MKINEIIKEDDNSPRLYFVKVRGNFYGGKYYETGIDSILVLASSLEEAVNTTKKNIKAVEQHFRAKRYANGKLAIAKNDKKKFSPHDVVGATLTKNMKHNKVLHSDGTIGPASVE